MYHSTTGWITYRLELVEVFGDVAEQLLLDLVPARVLHLAVLLDLHAVVQAGEQHHGGREHIVDAERRGVHGLTLHQVVLVERVEGRHGLDHRGLGLGQVVLCVPLLDRHLGLDLGHLLRLDAGLLGLHLHHGLLAGHVFGDGLGDRPLLLGLVQLDLEVLLQMPSSHTIHSLSLSFGRSID